MTGQYLQMLRGRQLLINTWLHWRAGITHLGIWHHGPNGTTYFTCFMNITIMSSVISTVVVKFVEVTYSQHLAGAEVNKVFSQQKVASASADQTKGVEGDVRATTEL